MRFDSDNNTVWFDKNFKNIGEAYAFSRNNNEIISFIVGIMCISAWRRYTCEKMGYAYERLYEYENKYTGLMLAAKNCYEALIGENASIAGMLRHFILTKTSGRVKGIKIEACQLDTAFIGSAEIASTMNKIIVQCYKKNIRLGSVFERNNGEKSIVWDRFISVPKHGGQWLFKLKATSSKRPAFVYWVNQQMFTLAEDAEYIEPVGCEKVNLLGGIGKPFVAVKYNGKCEIVNTNDVALPSPLDIGVRVFNTGGLENGIFGKDYREEAITFNTARDFIIYLRAYPEKVRDTCDQFYTAVYNAAYCLYTGKGFADYNGVRYYYFRYLLFTRLSIDMACKLGKNTGCISTKFKMGDAITFGDGPEGYMMDIGTYDLDENMNADIAHLAAYEGFDISGDPSDQLKQLITYYADTVSNWCTYYGLANTGVLYKWHEVGSDCLYFK